MSVELMDIENPYGELATLRAEVQVLREANRRLASPVLNATAQRNENQRNALLERYRVAWAIFRGLDIFDRLSPHAIMELLEGMTKPCPRCGLDDGHNSICELKLTLDAAKKAADHWNIEGL